MKWAYVVWQAIDNKSFSDDLTFSYDVAKHLRRHQRLDLLRIR